MQLKYILLFLIAAISIILLLSFSEDKNSPEKTPLSQRFDPEIQDFAFILPNLDPVEGVNGIKAKDGSLFFPNASINVPAAEWAFWMDDGNMTRAPEAAQGTFKNVRRGFGDIAGKVQRFDAGKEVDPGISTIAAPVFNDRGEVAAAVSISVPAQQVQPGELEVLIQHVRDAARQLTERISHSPNRGGWQTKQPEKKVA